MLIEVLPHRSLLKPGTKAIIQKTVAFNHVQYPGLIVLSVANIHAFHHPAATSSGSTYDLNGGISGYPFRQIIPVTDDTDMGEVLFCGGDITTRRDSTP